MPKGSERVLFIDDELPIVTMTSKMLERLGYRVTTEISSIEALALFRKDPDAFDLIITDMAMPNMVGDQLALELRKIRPDIPIILCTGYSKRLANGSAAMIGVRALLYKPIVKRNLARKVREVLDNSRDPQQGSAPPGSTTA